MSTKECPYAKSDMTPCVRKDGEIARADNGLCVGCERRNVWPDLYQEEGKNDND